MPWRYFKNCKTMDSMQGSLEILSRRAFYIYMGKKEQCALVADGESFTFFNSVEDSRKKVKLETGSKESCIYYHKNDASSREVRSKVDGLVAHGLCPQFQSRLAPVTKSCTATCLVQYPTWILPYLSIEQISSLLGQVKIFSPPNACSSWE